MNLENRSFTHSLSDIGTHLTHSYLSSGVVSIDINFHTASCTCEYSMCTYGTASDDENVKLSSLAQFRKKLFVCKNVYDSPYERCNCHRTQCFFCVSLTSCSSHTHSVCSPMLTTTNDRLKAPFKLCFKKKNQSFVTHFVRNAYMQQPLSL